MQWGVLNAMAQDDAARFLYLMSGVHRRTKTLWKRRAFCHLKRTLLELARQGFLRPEERVRLDTALVYRTFHLLTASEQHSSPRPILALQVNELQIADRRGNNNISFRLPSSKWGTNCWNWIR